MMKIFKSRQTHSLFILLLGGFFIAGCGDGVKTGHWLSGTTGAGNAAPTVLSTVPANNDDNVAINSNINATFNEAMSPATINDNTFRLVKDSDNTLVSGVVTPSGVNAVFNPNSNLDNNTIYRATITTGARNLAGVALDNNYVWRFTTGTTADNTAPVVIATVPLDNAIDVPVNQTLTATFSKAMNPATIDNTTFTVTRTDNTAVSVPGVVTSPTTISATFNPTALLADNTSYTATITTGAEDLAGNPLGVDNVWTFRTGSTVPGPGPAPVFIGSTLSKYAIIAGSTVTNTGPTLITGASSTTADLGVSPGSAVIGFPPGTVNGTIRFGADPDVAQAKLELTTAYNDAQGRTLAPITKSGNIGGQTLAPGLYKSTSSLAISSGDLTLAGPADGVWIFQVASTLDTTPGRQVILSGGALAKNIFWAVGTSATLGTTSVFYGNILADQSITLETGAVLNGRALTRIGAVTLDSNPVTKPLP